MTQLIYKNGCWTCKKAQADPTQEYTCPKVKEHWEEYQKQERNNF